MKSYLKPDSTQEEGGKIWRRSRIVAAAATLWRFENYDSVSIRQIAKAAGVVPATIYNLIGGINEILLAVIENIVKDFNIAIINDMSVGVDRIFNLIEITNSLYLEDPILYRQLVIRTPLCGESGVGFDHNIEQAIISAVREAQSLGQIKPDAEAEQIGRALFIAYKGVIFSWSSGYLKIDELIENSEIVARGIIYSFSSESFRLDLLSK